MCLCGCVCVNLSEQTHLPQVVVSLLQSGKLSQETLILSSLFIQLCTQSCTRLRHSLSHTLCTHTKRNKNRKKNTDGWKTIRVYLWRKADYMMLPSCAFSPSSKRAESSSFSLWKLSFSLCRTCNSLNVRENKNKWLKSNKNWVNKACQRKEHVNHEPNGLLHS